jgi:hypothetical protein
MSDVRGENMKLSPELESLIGDALGRSRFRGDFENPNQHEIYLGLLKRVAQKSDKRIVEWAARNEGEDMRAKLITIACDYSKRPSVYEEIDRMYFLRPKWEGGLDPRVSDPPEPDASVLNDQYRIVFEGLLLAPPSGLEHTSTMDAAGKTIGRVGDTRSLILFNFLFESGFPRLQTAVVQGLARMPSERAMATLLKCLSFALDRAKAEPYTDETQPWEKIRPFTDAKRAFSSKSNEFLRHYEGPDYLRPYKADYQRFKVTLVQNREILRG